MAKLNAKTLRKLVLETVEEIKNEKKLTSRKQELKSIIETAQKALSEDAAPGGVDPDRFPLELSAAAAKAPEAEKLVTGGDDDGEESDDTVAAAPGSMSVKDLKPSQSSMNIHKAVCFALAAIKKMPPFTGGPGGDLGAIITNDNHIMDGHHRWIASGMVDPSSSVGGYVVEFPAKKMIAALNMITVHLTGRTTGKEGSGGFDQFNEAGILAVLQDFAENGASVPGKGPWTGLEGPVVLEACEEFSGVTGEGALAAAAKKLGDNVSELTLSVPAGFPARPDMPVISKGAGHLDQAIELLRSGQVDLNEPYAESKVKSTNVILERWNTLAGLLK